MNVTSLLRTGPARLALAATLAIVAGPVAPGADLVNRPEHGLRLERGFAITEFAGPDLAPDTWCLTLDAAGRVVVANGRTIQTLLDTDGDGAADDAIPFASVERGVMGMCFAGSSLYVVADGWFMRYDDEDGDSEADGPPEKLLPLGFGEHGGHAMRQGPDGWWYLVGGNDTGFTATKHASTVHSPVNRPEAGAILRISPDGAQSEILAHGFRNPYDLDFNEAGDLFTYDSDVERDAFLPWNFPTRVYHVAAGQHHGWRLPGYKRSWPRPEYYTDTVPMLARLGRGSPTGVAAYRHTQFPAAWRDGLFLADWTFGRLHFLPLTPEGASYEKEEPWLFLEPMGTHGFAPTDLAVGPDGALFVSIGGRKTRGAVYRIRWAGPVQPPTLPPLPNADLNSVLLAAQPLDAWSRARWMPAARRLGAQPFGQFVVGEEWPDAIRVRAIEVLTELFGGVPLPRARQAAQSASAAVRARLAWALGRQPVEGAEELLAGLARDRDDAVRRFALEAMADRTDLFNEAELLQAVGPALMAREKYVRLAAVRIATTLSDNAWQDLARMISGASPAVSELALAQIWRSPNRGTHPEVIPALTNLLAQAREPSVRLDAVRLIILALGDWHLQEPAIEVFTAYEPPTPAKDIEVVLLRSLARAQLPSGDAALDFESARLLAMLEDDDRRTPGLLLQFITSQSDASADFHYLACLARLPRAQPANAARVAGALLALHSKLNGREARVKQNWTTRLVEVARELIRREPAVATELLRDRRLTTAGNVPLTGALEGEPLLLAARSFLATARADAGFPWSTELVTLLNLLPADEVAPLYRRQWQQVGLRDEMLPRLAARPVAADRPKFLAGLGSSQPAVVRASLDALLQLPPDPTGTNLVAPLRLLDRLLNSPAEQETRARVLRLISTSLKQDFPVSEPLKPDAANLRRAYQGVFDSIGSRYPGLLRAMNAEDQDDPARWNAIWKQVAWTKGDAVRGETVFAQRACGTCHGGAGAVGPDLAGVAQRMSPEDLMNAVVFPSRDVAPAYHTAQFRLRNGETHTGIVAFESADGWILQTGAASTMRIDAGEVTGREPGTVSLMPGGLLHGLNAQGLADLYAYLREMGR